MKTIHKLSMFAMIALFIAAVQSCKKDNSTSSSLVTPELKNQDFNIFYGPTVPMGKGVARAWVQENKNGEPLSVGIDLSEKALEGLPQEPTSWVLFFPEKKGMGFYKHMLVDWNPQGHVPVGVYDKPHFDFHFYWIPNDERLTIGPGGAPGFDSIPAQQYIPPYYLKTPGGVPQMGAHWVDLLAPEFNGGLFTKTFIWGSWNGSFIFFEPMITMAFLQSHPNGDSPVRQPAAFARDGWYPDSYQVSYSTSPNKYTIALLNLSFHNGE